MKTILAMEAPVPLVLGVSMHVYRPAFLGLENSTYTSARRNMMRTPQRICLVRSACLKHTIGAEA